MDGLDFIQLFEKPWEERTKRLWALGEKVLTFSLADSMWGHFVWKMKKKTEER